MTKSCLIAWLFVAFSVASAQTSPADHRLLGIDAGHLFVGNSDALLNGQVMKGGQVVRNDFH